MPDVLEVLIAERDRLNRAIEVLGGTVPKRRGRPPGSGKKATQKKAKKGRRARSTAARRRQSEKMKAYWAARKQAAEK